MVVLLAAIGWRTRRWRLLWLPVAAAIGIALAATVHGIISSQGLADDPAPKLLWVWLAVTGIAGVVFVVGWPGARWWRRTVSLVGVPLSLLCAALALNLWVGYFPTVQTAWNQVTAGPLPDQTDQATVVAMVTKHEIPTRGVVVPVDIGSATSGFKHRGELVYLPPAWFATNRAPHLPTLMMIGGEFNTPGDWLRAGNAIKSVDDFAAANGGNGLGGKDAAAHVSDQAAEANSLCALGAANGITCAVVSQPGKHDWPFAARAFAVALPWLAGQVGTPGIAVQGLPGSPPPLSHAQ